MKKMNNGPINALMEALDSVDSDWSPPSDAAIDILKELHPCPKEGHYIEDCRCWALIKISQLRPAIDIEHLQSQATWSERTFGPGSRSKGVVAHIRKELEEIEKDPFDLYEWVDVIILALDGAWRAGFSAEKIIRAIKEKQHINERRSWPDWRESTEGEAIEHIRG